MSQDSELNDGEPTCQQPDCSNPPLWRYTWPGKDVKVACLVCGMRLKTLANTIGLPLQMIQLEVDDYLRLSRG